MKFLKSTNSKPTSLQNQRKQAEHEVMILKPMYMSTESRIIL